MGSVFLLYGIGGVFLIGISLPLMYDKVPPNGFYGFRTASTLANTELWYRVNAFTGWSFIIVGLIGFAIRLARPELVENWGLPIIIGLTLCALGASLAYFKLIT